ncbi:MAG: hypothetical protein AAFX02_05630, partial [Pseudomonadota bacterium]
MLIQSLNDKDPASLALALAPLGDFVWLDSARPSNPLSRWSILSAAPVSKLVIWSDGRVEIDGKGQPDPPLKSLENFATQTPSGSGSIHDFEVTNYAIGYLNYEFARLLPIGRTLGKRDWAPRIVGQFGRYQSLIAIDHERDQAWLFSQDSTHAAMLTDCLNRSRAARPETSPLDWQADEDAESFKNK